MTLDDHTTAPALALHALAAEPAATLAARLGDPVPGADHGALVLAAAERHLAGGGTCTGDGLLEVLPDGFGFLRSARHDAAPQPWDVFVSPAQIRHLHLRSGHRVRGPVRPPRAGERFFGLAHIDAVQGAPALPSPPPAHHAVLPTRPLALGGDDADLAAIDRLAPWARGHRVLVTLPPDAGGASLCLRLAAALRAAAAELRLVLLLLDQRPEVHAAAHRAFDGDAGAVVLATTFDEPPARHGAVAELVLAAAQRDAEAGRDVVLLCDSLTALAHADNLALPPSGRLLRAGCDANAVLRGKRLFAAARALEGAGTLTVVATAVGGGSALDDALREPFRHRGNAEVTFVAGDAPGDARLDVAGTYTRSEDLPLPRDGVASWRRLRAELLALPEAERLDALHRTDDRQTARRQTER